MNTAPKTVILSLLLLAAFDLSAQKDTTLVGLIDANYTPDVVTFNNETIDVLKIDDVDVAPEYPGGSSALCKHLSYNIKYPKIALDQELKGIVILQLLILPDGSISTIRVAKSLSRECDKEAIRAARTLSKFKPAQKGGKPVAVWLNLPIVFDIY